MRVCFSQMRIIINNRTAKAKSSPTELNEPKRTVIIYGLLSIRDVSAWNGFAQSTQNRIGYTSHKTFVSSKQQHIVGRTYRLILQKFSTWLVRRDLIRRGRSRPPQIRLLFQSSSQRDDFVFRTRAKKTTLDLQQKYGSNCQKKSRKR